MRPTEILSAEHRVIEQVLDCLEKIAEDARRRGVLDVDASGKVMRVLKTFADDCHHGKEERNLFPMMHCRGMPTEVGPVAVMLEEHDVGRTHIRGMDSALRALSGGDRDALRTFVEHAFRYIELLRAHIGKEDNILFPMAEAVLTEADRRELLEAFARVEHAEMGAGTHETMLALADELAERFGVKKAAQRGAAAFSGCGHHAPMPGSQCGH
jgi:hemerythrin-like domain-containing protein